MIDLDEPDTARDVHGERLFRALFVACLLGALGSLVALCMMCEAGANAC